MSMKNVLFVIFVSTILMSCTNNAPQKNLPSQDKNEIRAAWEKRRLNRNIDIGSLGILLLKEGGEKTTLDSVKPDLPKGFIIFYNKYVSLEGGYNLGGRWSYVFVNWCKDNGGKVVDSTPKNPIKGYNFEYGRKKTCFDLDALNYLDIYDPLAEISLINDSHPYFDARYYLIVQSDKDIMGTKIEIEEAKRETNK